MDETEQVNVKYLTDLSYYRFKYVNYFIFILFYSKYHIKKNSKQN